MDYKKFFKKHWEGSTLQLFVHDLVESGFESKEFGPFSDFYGHSIFPNTMGNKFIDTRGVKNKNADSRICFDSPGSYRYSKNLGLDNDEHWSIANKLLLKYKDFVVCNLTKTPTPNMIYVRQEDNYSSPGTALVFFDLTGKYYIKLWFRNSEQYESSLHAIKMSESEIGYYQVFDYLNHYDFSQDQFQFIKSKNPPMKEIKFSITDKEPCEELFKIFKKDGRRDFKLTSYGIEYYDKKDSWCHIISIPKTVDNCSWSALNDTLYIFHFDENISDKNRLNNLEDPYFIMNVQKYFKINNISDIHNLTEKNFWELCNLFKLDRQISCESGTLRTLKYKLLVINYLLTNRRADESKSLKDLFSYNPVKKLFLFDMRLPVEEFLKFENSLFTKDEYTLLETAILNKEFNYLESYGKKKKIKQ